MEPQAIFDGSKLVAAGGATVFIAVEMIKKALSTTPQVTVLVAVAVSAVLTVLYGLSNGVLTVPNAFDLVVAAFAVAAVGSGISAAARA